MTLIYWAPVEAQYNNPSMMYSPLGIYQQQPRNPNLNQVLYFIKNKCHHTTKAEGKTEVKILSHMACLIAKYHASVNSSYMNGPWQKRLVGFWLVFCFIQISWVFACGLWYNRKTLPCIYFGRFRFFFKQ